jgi:hypothetical protein
MLEQRFALLAVAVILEGAVDAQMDEGQVESPRFSWRLFGLSQAATAAA